MKIVVGLGNPGRQYLWTRHNFGFLALDFYFKRKDLSWGSKPHYGALTGRSGDILFIKPQEFYNLSGRPVRELMRFYKVPTSDILVICDDFDLKFGTVRFRERGSSGGNNGLKSMIAELGTESFPRLRLGTGNNELRQKMGDVDFVLAKFTHEEKEKLPEILREVEQKIDEFCQNA